MFGPVHPWNNDNDNTREDLRRAMAENPYLNVLIQSGYYDGATTYLMLSIQCGKLIRVVN